MKRVAFALLALVSAAAIAATAPVTGEKEAASAIREDVIRAHVRFLSSDLLEGRGPATRGDRLAQEYIATQMEGMGLQPGAPGGGWFQKVELVGITPEVPERITIGRGNQTIELARREDFMAFSGVQKPEATVQNAEIVFVGYGIVAPEFGWDDFKGVDVKGKVLLVMNNDPENDPKLFGGKTRLWYGRWDYKYIQAARKGAAGVLIIHTRPSAGYLWQVVQTSWSGEKFELPDEGEPRIQVRGWVTEPSAKRIAELAGKNLDQLRAAAEKKDFRPVPLGVQVSIALRNSVQKKESANVIGKLPGGDSSLSREAVIYTAHHDHLGIKEQGQPGADKIYNGAQDNASGVAAMLAIAKAFTALPEAPRRTVFFAAVAAEEQGLLGSEYLSKHTPVAPGLIAANINIDGINIFGRTSDLTMIGLGKSDLDETVRDLLKESGRTLKGDQFPDRGFFYRSDQFNLAKVGVPAAYFDNGTEIIGKPSGWGAKKIEEWENRDYHQPSDQLTEDWDLSGAVEDTQVAFRLGARVANADAMPRWVPGDEFEATRKKALAAAGK
jgi:Zn-dependent M28 family amino/carboxypeptidase